MLGRLIARLTRNADYRSVFGTRVGKRVLADIYRQGHSNVNAGDRDATFVNIGRHELALHILACQGKDARDGHTMMQEEEAYDGTET